MTKSYLWPLTACLLLACQPGGVDETPVQTDVDAAVDIVDAPQIESGKVRLVLREPVSETHACILPIRVENGLSTEANVVMIAFDVTGPGGETKGNMFAPAAGPGDSSEARVILEGNGCDGYDTVTVNEHNCSSQGESCVENLIFVNGNHMRFNAGE